MSGSGIRLFGTSPRSKDVGPSEYRERLAARWSEGAGLSGILVHADSGLVVFEHARQRTQALGGATR